MTVCASSPTERVDLEVGTEVGETEREEVQDEEGHEEEDENGGAWFDPEGSGERLDALAKRGFWRRG
jgi:hypothetical protein